MRIYIDYICDVCRAVIFLRTAEGDWRGNLWKALLKVTVADIKIFGDGLQGEFFHKVKDFVGDIVKVHMVGTKKRNTAGV